MMSDSVEDMPNSQQYLTSLNDRDQRMTKGHWSISTSLEEHKDRGPPILEYPALTGESPKH